MAPLLLARLTRACPARLSRLKLAPRLAMPSRTMASSALALPHTPLFEAIARQDPRKTAIVHSVSGKQFTYGQLLGDVAAQKAQLLEITGHDDDLAEERIAMLVENGYDYVVSLLAVFASGGIAVPLCTSHPPKEMCYVLSDSSPTKLIATEKFRQRALEICEDKSMIHWLAKHTPDSSPSPKVGLTPAPWDDEQRGALIIYTSGTTNAPKGVISTHLNLYTQAHCLETAWKITDKDHLLHVLPLHHVHGVVNATLAPLMAGATVEYLFPFSAPNVWSRLTDKQKPTISLFMAVPTIYQRLLSAAPEGAREAIAALRLAISGSAALPSSIREAWRNLAGTASGGGTMLERYGMTEIGMALSNKLDKRVDNAVGWPLPGVKARLVSPEGQEVTEPDTEGEIQIAGPTVFREYYNKPDATMKEFVHEGGERWFKTGDVAVRDSEGCYYIRGRASVDIIKTGGEKVSALEVEREMLELDEVEECAVVGLEDPEWGQKVAAVVVLSKEAAAKSWGKDDMRAAMKKRVANYKVPTVLKAVEQIPRNQMGKINKKTLIKDVF